MRTDLLATFLATFLAAAGCASEQKRRPVEELYREALGVARIANDPAEKAAREANAARRAASARSEPLAVVEEAPAPTGVGAHEVSDVFNETDLRDAIQSLANQAGVRVAIDDAVRGPVTASFDRARFEDALSDLTAPRGLVFDRRGDRYLVGSADPKSAMFSLLAETHQYVPRHLTPGELLEVLPRFAAPYVTVSAARNLIGVTAPRAMATRILEALGRADRPVPQVVLEAIVCEWSPKSSLQTGFDFEAAFKTGGGTFANVGINDLVMAGAAGPAGAAGVVGLKSFEFYSTLVKALATEGYVSVRAAPRVMVRDGEHASISIGEDTFFTVSNERFFFAQLQAIRSGITLELTPRIRAPDVSIKLDRAEVSDELRPSQVTSGDDSRLPSISSRKVSTTVTVRDGETIVIGGLLRRRQVDRVAKVPLLGDIPGLGLLFQKRDQREEETEVAIFICPRIVTEVN